MLLQRMRKLVLIWAVLSLGTMLSGCLKDDPGNQTIILFGEEKYVKTLGEMCTAALDSIDSVAFWSQFNEVLINHLDSVTIDSITSMGPPPDLRGEYRFAVRELDYASSPFPSPNDVAYFRFGGEFSAYNDYLQGQQHYIIHCDLKLADLPMSSDVFHSDTTYVKGDGDRFVAYFERKVRATTDYDANRVVEMDVDQIFLLSGNMVPVNDSLNDVHNARLAIYNRDVAVVNWWVFNASELEQLTSTKGRIVVFKDSDSISEGNPDKNHPYINWNE